jgi:hypothetical protein
MKEAGSACWRARFFFLLTLDHETPKTKERRRIQNRRSILLKWLFFSHDPASASGTGEAFAPGHKRTRLGMTMLPNLV